MLVNYSERLPGIAEAIDEDPIDNDQPNVPCITGEHVRDYMPEDQVDLYLGTIFEKIDATLAEHGIQPPSFET